MRTFAFFYNEICKICDHNKGCRTGSNNYLTTTSVEQAALLFFMALIYVLTMSSVISL